MIFRLGTVYLTFKDQTLFIVLTSGEENYFLGLLLVGINPKNAPYIQLVNGAGFTTRLIIQCISRELLRLTTVLIKA
jgi:hypothetical protein